MRLGVLTGGGDCPGLNAAIRAIVRRASVAYPDDIVGFHNGWQGVVEDDAMALDVAACRGILPQGGTILATSRFNPFKSATDTERIAETIAHRHIDALIAIGGEGSLRIAREVSDLGIPVVGIPKTIDNDVFGTKRCIGFDTAVATAADAIDRVQTTGESHDRLMVVEVMGRSTGWLAVCAGISAGADALCLPEEKTDLDQLAAAIRRRHDAGSSSSVVVVAEGAKLVGSRRSSEGTAGSRASTGLAERTGYETRLTVLGHIQRGGPPSAADRLLATTCGVGAINAIHASQFGSLVSVADDAINLVPLELVAESRRPVPELLLDVARKLTVR